MRTAVALFAVCASLTACSHLGAASDGFFSGLADLFNWNSTRGNAERGQDIAAHKCAACHPLTAAPPATKGMAASFPELSARAVLTTARLNAVLSRFPHPMPPIALTKGDIADLIAFLRMSPVMPKPL